MAKGLGEERGTPPFFGVQDGKKFQREPRASSSWRMSPLSLSSMTRFL